MTGKNGKPGTGAAGKKVRGRPGAMKGKSAGNVEKASGDMAGKAAGDVEKAPRDMAGKAPSEKEAVCKTGMRASAQMRIWIGMGVCVLILALWHFLDVRDGVRVSGDRWLYGWYAGLVVWAAVVLGGLGYCVFFRKPRRLEFLFAGAVLGLGIMYLLVLPPLSAPDEVSHYITSYQLANRLMGKPNHEDGIRVYIRAQDRFIEDLENVLNPDGSGYREEENRLSIDGQDTEGRGQEAIMGFPENEPKPDGQAAGDSQGNREKRQAVILGQELTENTYRTIHGRGIGSGERDGRAVSYQIPVRTTPLAYVPQALGLIAAQVLGLGGLGLLYMGRLFNLLFFTAIGCLTIRRLPFGKEVFFGVALLPMTLHLAASFSYDVMLIALCSWFTAVCLDLAYRAGRVRWQDVLLLAVIMGVMGPCKMVYGVAAGLCLLIPVKKFGGWGRWALSAAAVLGAFAVAMLLVNSRTVALYTDSSAGYVGYVNWAEAPGYTFGELVRSPLLVLKLCYNTLMWQGGQLYTGMIGGALGNMDEVLNTPYVVILGLTAILLMLAFRKPGETLYISMKGRAWIWFLGFICLGALMFSMLLAWTPKGSTMINGVQGRYLLPLLLALLVTLKNDSVVRTGWNDGALLYVMMGLDVYVAIRIFSIVCLRVS